MYLIEVKQNKGCINAFWLLISIASATSHALGGALCKWATLEGLIIGNNICCSIAPLAPAWRQCPSVLCYYSPHDHDTVKAAALSHRTSNWDCQNKTHTDNNTVQQLSVAQTSEESKACTSLIKHKLQNCDIHNTLWIGLAITLNNNFPYFYCSGSVFYFLMCARASASNLTKLWPRISQ